MANASKSKLYCETNCVGIDRLTVGLFQGHSDLIDTSPLHLLAISVHCIIAISFVARILHYLKNRKKKKRQTDKAPLSAMSTTSKDFYQF